MDVALRQLLMEIGLPKETQHIDRMMEAFAARYLDCNPDLFADKGPYRNEIDSGPILTI